MLIGGPPGAGKTTLGSTLACRLGMTSLTIDDLLTATRCVTTLHTHPGLHMMAGVRWTDYYTNRSAEELIEAATLQHHAIWPVIEALVRKRVTTERLPVVIDGWSLLPERVASLQLEGVVSVWLVIEPAVLRNREARNSEFLRGSSDPKRMFDNFMARSLHHNSLVETQASRHGLPIVRQVGTKSVDALCDEARRLLGLAD
jgi:2-phosphoglycerate kinase